MSENESHVPVATPQDNRDFLKKAVDFIPSRLFPQLNPSSAHTAAIIGGVLGIVSVIFSLIPCLGAWAFLFSLPGLYVNLMAIRRAPSRSGAMAIVGLICCLIATYFSFSWFGAVAATSKELDNLDTSLNGLDTFTY